MPFHAGDIESTLELDRSPFNQGLRLARIDADKFEKRKITATIDVDKSRLDATLKGSPTTGKQIKIPADLDQKRLFQQLERIGDNTETAARRSGNRLARALLNPLVIQLGLLPAIAAASAAGVGLALAVVPVAFGALAAVALKSNLQVVNSYRNLWKEVKEGTKEAASGMSDDLVRQAGILSAGFQRMRPELRGLFDEAGPALDHVTNGLVGLVHNLLPGFRVALERAEEGGQGFERMLGRVGTGISDFFIGLATNSTGIATGMDEAGRTVQILLGLVGQLLGKFSEFWAGIGGQFNDRLAEFGETVLHLADRALPVLGQGLEVTLDLLGMGLQILEPFTGTFGTLIGIALSSVATWKLVSLAIGGVTKALSLMNPLKHLGDLSTVSSRMPAFVTAVGGSTAAGEKMQATTSKIGTALARVGSALPVVGVAAIIAGAAFDQNSQQAAANAQAIDALALSLIRGGDAYAAASSQIGHFARIAKQLEESGQGALAEKIRGIIDQVSQSYQKQISSMTEVEVKQEELRQAQVDYDNAVRKFGPHSDAAASRSGILAAKTREVADAQRNAARATQSHIDKIVEETTLLLGSIGARLNYQGSLLSLEQAQKAAAEATAEHGAKSLEARTADNQYQQQLLSVITAVGERAKAENAAKSEIEQNQIATLAMHQEIARLAVVAGKDAPAALLQLAAGLSDAELKALGVTREVDKTGRTIYKLPPGKSLNFPTDAPIAQQQISNLHTAIDNLPRRKNFDYVISVVTGQNQGTGGAPLPGLLGLPTRAEGGPVRRNTAYWVGEAGVPELFFPNVDGFVLNGRDSQRLASQTTGAVASAANLAMTEGQFDPDVFIEAVVIALTRVFQDLRIRVDGQEWATLVNSANVMNRRR